jgi:hypothetical protein
MTLSKNVPQHNDTHGTQHKSVQSRCDECCVLFTAMLSVIVLGVVMLDVVMLGVVAPLINAVIAGMCLCQPLSSWPNI